MISVLCHYSRRRVTGQNAETNVWIQLFVFGGCPHCICKNLKALRNSFLTKAAYALRFVLFYFDFAVPSRRFPNLHSRSLILTVCGHNYQGLFSPNVHIFEQIVLLPLKLNLYLFSSSAKEMCPFIFTDKKHEFLLTVP